MKNKYLKIIPVLAVSLLSCINYANDLSFIPAVNNVYADDTSQEVIISGITYKKYHSSKYDYITNNKIEYDYFSVVKCDDSVINADILSDIDGISVCEIEDGVFRFHNNLEYVKLPNSIHTLDARTFKNCRNLKEINIPEGVEYLNTGCFCECTSLNKISLPSTLKYIEADAFKNCTSLESIYLPDNLERIGLSAFDDCTSLVMVDNISESIDFHGNPFDNTPWVESIRDESGFVIIGDQLLSIKASGDVVIPSNVRVIESFAANDFHCYDLGYKITSITIPSSVEIIEGLAFYGNKSIESVILSEGLRCIGINAFEECTNLKEITIPKSVELIDDKAFSFCSNLEKITILNPECKIRKDDDAICNYTSDSLEDIIICGYSNSTAEIYSNLFNKNFESIGEFTAPFAIGDVNGDKLIDAVDATNVLSDYAVVSTGGDSTFNDMQKDAADLNKDGYIDAVDATLILIHYSYASTGKLAWDVEEDYIFFNSDKPIYLDNITM